MSFIPIPGLFLGVAVCILWAMGLRRARLHPEAKGRAYAWIGAIVSGIFGMIRLVVSVLIIIAVATERN
jgi:hypothetical protein